MMMKYFYTLLLISYHLLFVNSIIVNNKEFVFDKFFHNSNKNLKQNKEENNNY
jgi:hypothetical protein